MSERECTLDFEDLELDVRVRDFVRHVLDFRDSGVDPDSDDMVSEDCDIGLLNVLRLLSMLTTFHIIM